MLSGKIDLKHDEKRIFQLIYSNISHLIIHYSKDERSIDEYLPNMKSYSARAPLS